MSSLVNIALDLLFVGVFHMGVGSAALATAISQFVSIGFASCACAAVTRSTVCVRKIRFERPCSRSHIGLPAGVQNTIIAIANVVVQSNINAFGATAMAGCGAHASSRASPSCPSPASPWR